VGSESLRLLGEVITLDSNLLVCQPVEIRRESHERRIDCRAAHTRWAAHWGIEDFNFVHVYSFRLSTKGDSLAQKNASNNGY
jgi:hypothetical protein